MYVRFFKAQPWRCCGGTGGTTSSANSGSKSIARQSTIDGLADRLLASSAPPPTPPQDTAYQALKCPPHRLMFTANALPLALQCLLWVGRLRGERKLLEESPDTEGQGRWVTPTRGNPRESATEIHGRWRDHT